MIYRQIAFILCALSLTGGGAAAFAENAAQLPAGRYVYLGTDPTAAAPKAFNVTASGEIIWQDGHPAAPIESASATAASKSVPDIIHKVDISPVTKITRSDSGGANTPTFKPPANECQNIEKYEWPMIKFRPKPLPDAPDSFAQLTTTEVLNDSSSYYASTSVKVKYKLILLRAEPQSLGIELLDAQGFRLGSRATVSSTEFETIPGTDLVAARGEFTFALADYPKVRDFTLTRLGYVKRGFGR